MTLAGRPAPGSPRGLVLRACAIAALVACAACAGATVDDGIDDGGLGDGGRSDAAQQDAPPFFADAPVGDGGPGPADAFVQQDVAPPCYPDPDETVGNATCATAVVKASLSDATSAQVSVTGNIWPESDVDWYRVAFVDSADTPGVCDPFNVRIAFAQNPGDHYRFDVLLDNCTDPPTCDATEQSTGLTTFSYTDAAACPCVQLVGDPPNTSDGVHVCIDHSMTLRVRVFRVSGAPVVCENYELSIANG